MTTKSRRRVSKFSKIFSTALTDAKTDPRGNALLGSPCLYPSDHLRFSTFMQSNEP